MTDGRRQWRGAGGNRVGDNRFDEDAVERLPLPGFGAIGGAVVVAFVVAAGLVVVDRGRPPWEVADRDRRAAGGRRHSGPPAGGADGDCFDEEEEAGDADGGVCAGVEPETGFAPYQSSGAK